MSILAPDPPNDSDEVAVATPVLLAPSTAPASTWMGVGVKARAPSAFIVDEGAVFGFRSLDGIAVFEAESCSDRNGCAVSIVIGEPSDRAGNIGGGRSRVSFVFVYESSRLELLLSCSSRSITFSPTRLGVPAPSKIYEACSVEPQQDGMSKGAIDMLQHATLLTPQECRRHNPPADGDPIRTSQWICN